MAISFFLTIVCSWFCGVHHVAFILAGRMRSNFPKPLVSNVLITVITRPLNLKYGTFRICETYIASSIMGKGARPVEGGYPSFDLFSASARSVLNAAW